MRTEKRYSNLIATMLFTCMLTVQIFAAGIVPEGTSQLSDDGSSASPAAWWFDGDYVSPAGSLFEVGVRDGGNASYNELTVSNGLTFTASSGLWVGRNNTFHNQLNIQNNARVVVNGSANCGDGSIMYYGKYNHINISGVNARLSVTENLDFSDGYNATENYLSISDGGIAVVDSDKNGSGSFSLYYHWSYGNCWMELDGGSLLLYGDKTADFASGNGILSSIKVWNAASNSLQRVAYYDSQTLKETDSINLLEVDYIENEADAIAHGLDNEFVGFTVVKNIPEPTTIGLSLFALGILWWREKSKKGA
jgi:hypothetical protein